MLRFESSNQLGNRMTVEPVELGGIALPAGTPVTLCIGAANRDPAQFADPERLDIGRTPNRHLAFGTGAHQCAGMALARLEGAIAISRFLARFPDYALRRRTGARRPGPLPRISERAVCGSGNAAACAREIPKRAAADVQSSERQRIRLGVFKLSAAIQPIIDSTVGLRRSATREARHAHYLHCKGR